MSQNLTTANPSPPTGPQEARQTRGGWHNLNIGRKLIIGFGVLVAISLLIAAWSYLGSQEATNKINLTEQVRVPTALDSSEAQANLLRLQASVRGYLALGEDVYRQEYRDARAALETDLARLQARSTDLDAASNQDLAELKTRFAELAVLPETLFDLRDDQLQREPALRLLLEDANDSYSGVLQNISNMIEIQGKLIVAADELDPDQIVLLDDMVNFQFSFGQMISGLRGYVTTRRPAFKSEYETQLRRNEAAWERLVQNQGQMPAAQRQIFEQIAADRDAFLTFPEQMFAILEAEDGSWRVDLFRFRTEAVPLTEAMIATLTDLTASQQEALQTDLAAGRQGLSTARIITLVSGVVAFVLGIVLTLFFRSQIAGPVVRLTGVANRIREGDLEAQAPVESGDEIGVLAFTFNNMTDKLRGTLHQVRQEKSRADSLLDVVIPIGVELSTEKDFNRLLETMLSEARTFCQARAGVLYLREEEGLRPVIIHNDDLNLRLGGISEHACNVPALPLAQNGHPRQAVAVAAAQEGHAVNVANVNTNDAVMAPAFFNEPQPYTAQSFLSIPLKNSQQAVLGVLELVNAQDPDSRQVIPFDPNLQQLMESFSSLAVAALEAYLREQSLKQEIQRLRIEIDESKRQQQVKKIVESDSFRDLQSKAEAFRQRMQRPRSRSRRRRDDTGAGESEGES